MLDFRRMLPSARRKPHGPRSSRGPRWPSSWLNDRKRDWIIAAHRGFGRDRCERACIAVQHKSADGAVGGFVLDRNAGTLTAIPAKPSMSGDNPVSLTVVQPR